MTFDDLQRMAIQNGLTAVDHKGGHWSLKGGQFIVHFWPKSKKKTIWAEGTKYKKRNGTMQKAIDIALGKIDIPNSLILPKHKNKSVKTYMLMCPECGGKMRLRNSRYGKFYGCENWPKCQATHGAHPDGQPLGKPADQETKKARIRAHAAFDKTWNGVSVKNARNRAYKFLANQMELTADQCHIGMFTKQQCEQVVKLCKDVEFWHRMLESDIDIASANPKQS